MMLVLFTPVRRCPLASLPDANAGPVPAATLAAAPVVARGRLGSAAAAADADEPAALEDLGRALGPGQEAAVEGHKCVFCCRDAPPCSPK